VTAIELLDELRLAGAAPRLGGPAGAGLAVELRAGDPQPSAAMIDELASRPVVVVGVHPPGIDVDPGWRALVDVLVDEDDPAGDDIAATLAEHPVAATALALLLRSQEGRRVGDGLVAESAVYSTLQAGPDFAAWRAGRPVRDRDDGDDPRVEVERAGAVLRVTLTRPAVHNALDARMRDQLLDALAVALADGSIATVELRGRGPSFCAGGDLDEFGTRSDPATAHLLRLHRSPARALAGLGGRMVTHLHGAAVGSGIELAAFAGMVVADPDTRIALPEVGLGLVPGAGGTVSLPARIGRHRTAWLALSRRTIDAATAAAWGLIDRIAP
jgi:enoyl-CoA hydratase/carnithine racemase